MEFSKLVIDFSKITNPDGFSAHEAQLNELRQKLDEVDEALLFLGDVNQDGIRNNIQLLKSYEEARKSAKFRFLTKSKLTKQIKDLIYVLNKQLRLSNGIDKYLDLPDSKENAEFFNEVMIRIEESIRKANKDQQYLLSSINELEQKFYLSERERYFKEPINEEEMLEALSEKNLKSLSTKDYMTLLGRYPSGYLAHITQQGLRDSGDMLGDHGFTPYLQNGLKGILKSNMLCSSLQAVIEQGNDPVTAVQKKLELSHYLMPQQIEHLHTLRTRAEMLFSLHLSRENPLASTKSIAGWLPSEVDQTAVLFSNEEVFESFGAETGNNCFFVIPQAVAAANYTYVGNLLNTKSANSFNGLFPNNNRGIPLEAMLIFLPGNAQVDPNTGSKYKTVDGQCVLGDDGRPVLASDTIPSRIYWEQYLKENHPDKNLKICYYDTECRNLDVAIRDTFKDYGVASWQLPIEKRFEVENYIRKKDQCFHRKGDIKNKMHQLFPYVELEEAINVYYDLIEQDPNIQSFLTEQLRRTLEVPGMYYRGAGETSDHELEEILRIKMGITSSNNSLTLSQDLNNLESKFML